MSPLLIFFHWCSAVQCYYLCVAWLFLQIGRVLKWSWWIDDMKIIQAASIRPKPFPTLYLFATITMPRKGHDKVSRPLLLNTGICRISVSMYDTLITLLLPFWFLQMGRSNNLYSVRPPMQMNQRTRRCVPMGVDMMAPSRAYPLQHSFMSWSICILTMTRSLPQVRPQGIMKTPWPRNNALFEDWKPFWTQVSGKLCPLLSLLFIPFIENLSAHLLSEQGSFYFTKEPLVFAAVDVMYWLTDESFARPPDLRACACHSHSFSEQT